MITSNNIKRLSRKHRTRGFTLVEIMISVTLLALVLASMIPAFGFFSKSVRGLGNYTLMSSESRQGLEILSRDLHVAEELLLAQKQAVTLVLPFDSGGDTINYEWDPDTLEFVRTVTDLDGTVTDSALFEDVEEFDMLYFNRLNEDITEDASVLVEAKSIQIKAKLVKAVLSTENTDYIISARFLMRNL